MVRDIAVYCRSSNALGTYHIADNPERHEAMCHTVNAFVDLCSAIYNFRESLTEQKYSFEFRRVRRWVASLWVSAAS